MGALGMSVVGSGVALSFVVLLAAQPEAHISAAEIEPVDATPWVGSMGAAEDVAREAARAGAEQSRRGDDDFSMQLPAETPYRGLFQKYGARRGVEPALLAAIASQESSFNPWAGCNRSGAGKGIMQIENQPQYCGPEAIDASIDKAARMLGDYHRRSGSWDAAVFAFNNGPGLMDEWVRYSDDSDKMLSVLADHYNDHGPASRKPKQGYATWGEWRARVAYSYAAEKPLPGFRSATQKWLSYRQSQ